MDFNDSPAEAAFRSEARAFLDEHAPEVLDNPYEQDSAEDQLRALPGARDWQRTLYEHGWAALLWPAEYGGRGCGPIEQFIWNQELGRKAIGDSIFLGGVGLIGPTRPKGDLTIGPIRINLMTSRSLKFSIDETKN